jgi:NAD-dependent DNA ligase
MLKIIIGLLIIGIILYAIFGIGGIIISAVIFVGIIIAAIRNADKNPIPGPTEHKNSNYGSGLVFEAEIDIPNMLMSITYKDNNDTTTKRDVNVYKIGMAGNSLYIRGHCHSRNEERTFKVDRIIEAVVNGDYVHPIVFITNLCKGREEFDKCLLNGVNFCLTGTLKIMTRRQAQERIEAFGGGFHKYIRYDTHFLVAEDSNRNTGKLVEAKAHGITIIDEDTFIDYMTEPAKAQAEKRVIKDQYEYYKESVENDLDYKKSYIGGGKIDEMPPKVDNFAHSDKVSFCFTGDFKYMSRGQAEERVKIWGGCCKPSVVNSLSYLVTNDPESGSSKNKKARELGIPVINEEEFITLLSSKATL